MGNFKAALEAVMSPRRDIEQRRQQWQQEGSGAFQAHEILASRPLSFVHEIRILLCVLLLQFSAFNAHEAICWPSLLHSLRKEAGALTFALALETQVAAPCHCRVDAALLPAGYAKSMQKSAASALAKLPPPTWNWAGRRLRRKGGPWRCGSQSARRENSLAQDAFMW